MLEFSIYTPIVKPFDGIAISDRVRVEFVLPKRPLLFWVGKKTGDSLDLPKGYGVAYYDSTCAKLLYAFIPFNVFIGAGIWLWEMVKWRFAHIVRKTKGEVI